MKTDFRAAQILTELAHAAKAKDFVPRIPDHELLRCIGRGSYGEVWLARNIMGTWRAVKVVYRSHFDHDRPFEREFEGIKRFEPISRCHDSQVDILHVGRNDAEGYFYYVMELADDVSGVGGQSSLVSSQSSVVSGQSSVVSGGEVRAETYVPKTLRSELQRQSRFSVEETVEIGLALTTALEHLHGHGLVHRDIKPSNIIYVNGRPKLGDIGLVAAMDQTVSFVGTEGYVPPEGPGSVAADLYSLGKVLYEVCTGRDRQQFPELPTNLEGRRDEAGLLELNEVLLKACQRDPQRRYVSAQQMREDLLLLQSGKSVVRLRTLEKRLAVATRIGIVAAVVAALAAVVYTMAHRGHTVLKQHLVRLSVAHGQRLMDEGDWFGALLWFTETLKLEEGNSRREQVDRRRIDWLLQQSPKLRQLWFHRGMVNRIILSPDERRVATSSEDGTARVWELETGQAVSPFLEHGTGVVSMVFSPDGTQLLTGARDGTARVWEIPSGTLLGEPLRHPRPVWHVDFSRDGKQFLTVNMLTGGDEMDGEVRLWEAATLQLRKVLPQSRARDGAFSPDGKRVLTVGADGTARIWEAWTGEAVTPIMGHPAAVQQGKFSPDGQRVATVCGGAATVRVWDALTGDPVTVPLRHESRVREVDFSGDGRYVATLDYGRSVSLWDAATGAVAFPPLRHPHPISHIAFIAGGLLLLTRGEDQVVRLWDAAGGRLRLPEIKCASPITRPVMSRNGRWLVLGGRDGMVRVWEIRNRVPARVLEYGGGIQGTAFSPDGQFLATVGGDSCQLWNVATGQLAQRMRFADFPVAGAFRSVDFTEDGRRLLIAIQSPAGVAGGKRVRWEARVEDLRAGKELGSPVSITNTESYFVPFSFSRDGSRALVIQDDMLRGYDVATGRLLWPPLKQAGRIVNASFSVDGQRLIVVSDHKVLKFWDANSGQHTAAPFRYAFVLDSLCLSPDGQTAAVGAADGTAHLFDVNTGRRIAFVQKHSGAVRSVAFSADNRRLLTVSADDSAGIWDARTGKLLAPFLRGLNGKSPARFSPDGTMILALSREGAAQLWDVETGQPITPPANFSVDANDVRFSPDGRQLAISCADGNVRIWKLHVEERPVADLIEQAQLYADHRIDSYSSFVPLLPNELSNAWHRLQVKYPAAVRKPKSGGTP